MADANNLFGAQAVPKGVGTQILALRIIVTVHEDNSSFRLDLVVTQKNQAKAVASAKRVTLPDGTTTHARRTCTGRSQQRRCFHGQ